LELIARTLGEPPILMDPAIIAAAAARYKKARATPEYGVPEWDALRRMIAAQEADYRR